MKIIFIDLNKECVNALKSAFANIESVEVIRGNITQPPVKGKNVVVVTAGNSFGEMNGGIDGAINTYLSNAERYIQEDVKELISQIYFGEQPVGTCLLLRSLNPEIGFLAHAPTMRVPKDVSSQINAYLAFRAVLTTIIRYNTKNNNNIQTVLCPTFCTGAGCVDPINAAKQIRIAYDSVMHGTRKTESDWKTIWEKDRELMSFTKT